MVSRRTILLASGVLSLTALIAPAHAQDAELCFSTADLVKSGEKIADQDRRTAHAACQRALAETSSIVQKYHLQEADFDVTGTRPKP